MSLETFDLSSKEVFLKPNFLDCKFSAHVPDGMKTEWYKEWWANHTGKAAKVVKQLPDGTLYIQFGDDNTKYVVSTEYLNL